MQVSHYQAKQYGPQPCWELVADLYATERKALHVGYEQKDRTLRGMADAFRLAVHHNQNGFKCVGDPSDYCIVLLGKNQRIGIHHCGVYFDGRVLHAMPGITLFEPLSVIRDRFELVEFWAQPPARSFEGSTP